MDPVPATAMALSVGSSAVKAGGSLMAGKSQQQQYNAEAGKMQVAASEARLRATEIDGAYAEELSQTLANLRSITAAKNRNIDSPTAIPMEERARDVSMKQSQKAVSNEMKKAAQADSDAVSLRRAGKTALTAAYLKAAPDMLAGVSSIAGGIPKKGG